MKRPRDVYALLVLFTAIFSNAFVLSPWNSNFAKNTRSTNFAPNGQPSCVAVGDAKVLCSSSCNRKLDPLFSHSTEMEEYNQKLVAAEKAIAELQEARQKIKATSAAPKTTPVRSRTAIVSKSDAGTLNIEFPPSGLSLNSVFAGTFSIAWFSAVIPATFTGLWWFMLPFWAAGAMVAKQAVDPFVSSKLSIGEYAWSLKTVLGGENGIKLHEHEGATSELRMVYPEVVEVVNDNPRYALKLLYGQKIVNLPIGVNVSDDELQYLVATINSYLVEMQNERA